MLTPWLELAELDVEILKLVYYNLVWLKLKILQHQL